MNLFVGPAKGTEALEGLDEPEGQAGLLAARALTNGTVSAALGQRPGSVGYEVLGHVSG